MKTPFYKTGKAKTPLFNHVPGHTSKRAAPMEPGSDESFLGEGKGGYLQNKPMTNPTGAPEGSDSYFTGDSEGGYLQGKSLPDPKITKPKQARQMKRDGEITKSEFKDYKQARSSNKEAYKTVNTANVNEDGVRGTAKRSQWNRKVKMGKRAIATGRKMSTAIKEGASDSKVNRLTDRYEKQKTKQEAYRKKIVKFDGTSTIGKKRN